MQVRDLERLVFEEVPKAARRELGQAGTFRG